MKKAVIEWIKSELDGPVVKAGEQDLVIENDDYFFRWHLHRLTDVVKKSANMDWENFYYVLGYVYDIVVKAFKMDSDLEVTRND